MDKKKVDLHGLYVDDAQIEVLQHLPALLRGQVESITFITGRGTGALQSAIESILLKEGLEWEVRNSGAEYFVKCKVNKYTYYTEIEEQEDMQNQVDDIFEDYKNI